MIKLKCIHINNSLKLVRGSSGGCLDYFGFKDRIKDCAIEVENGDEADLVIFFQSNLNAFGGVLDDIKIQRYYEICRLSQTKKILYMFSDFLIMFKIQDKMLKRFGKDVPTLNKDNFYVIHYCQDNEGFKNYWNSKKDNFKTDNFIYRDLSQNCPFDNMLISDNYINKVCYIGNNRSGNRNNFLSNFKDIDIYGKWQDKFKINGLNYMNKVDVKLVPDILNKYHGQLCTYDEIGIKYKATSYRLFLTITCGILPIIDNRLKYLGLPEEFNKLFINSQEDVNNLLSMSFEDRKDIIIKLRLWFEEYFKQRDYKILFEKLLNNV